MKYRNQKPYLTYALNAEGELVHIDSVPNGNDCTCFCPHCKSELCAKNAGSGEKMVHHFAHISGVDCVGAIESALHKMAKDIMKDSLCLQLPNRQDGSRGELLKLDRVEVEFYDRETGLRPDCVGYYEDKVIWIEFKRTHAVDAKKKEKIISAKIDCVELDLNVCELDTKAVRDFIINDRQNRIWIEPDVLKTETSGNNVRCSSYDIYNDCYGDRQLKRVFAKDENGILVNLLDGNVDMNARNYYCLVCGKELTIDIDKLGNCIYVHVDDSIHCDDEIYLYEAAKYIIQYKFITSDVFEILIPQYLNCSENIHCDFFQNILCSINKKEPYDLKQHNYVDCLKDYKLHDFKYKCDLVIKTADGDKNTIIINVNKGNCYAEIDNGEYKVINITVSNSNDLFLLLNDKIGQHLRPSDFKNFKRCSKKTVPRSEISREILKFSLFSSGRYYVAKVPCDKVEDKHKYSTVLEYTFGRIQEKYVAKTYSLVQCYKQNLKACFCEICCSLVKINDFNGSTSKRICERFKTNGTPHFPLDVMPMDCPYFRIDEEIEKMVEKYNYGDVKKIIK